MVDLHALTVPQDPAQLRAETLGLATTFLAVGIDPTVSIVFVQSHVHEHSELAWLMECTASIGELRRMTQFKDKAETGRGGRRRVRVRRPAHLPGAHGRRHPPLRHRRGAGRRRPAPARRAHPRPRHPLQQPLRRHLRRPEGDRPAGRRPGDGPAGPDPQDVEVGGLPRRHDPPARGAGRHRQEDQAGGHRHRGRGPLRPGRPSPACRTCSRSWRPAPAARPRRPPRATRSTARSRTTPPRRWWSCWRPIRARHAELAADPAEVHRILDDGAERARKTAATTLARARAAVGLLPPR